MRIQPNTPYEGGVFAVSFIIPEKYPLVPPVCRFITPVYHPNIDEMGRICLDLFQRESPLWTFELSKLNTNVTRCSVTDRMTAVLTALCSLLGHPNCNDDALRPDVAQEFLRDRYQFDTKARLLTQSSASRKYVDGVIPKHIFQGGLLPANHFGWN